MGHEIVTIDITPEAVAKTAKGNTQPKEIWLTFWDIYEGERTYLGGVSDKPWDATYDAPITAYADNVRYVPAAETAEAQVERLLELQDNQDQKLKDAVAENARLRNALSAAVEYMAFHSTANGEPYPLDKCRAALTGDKP
jgi:hypothetical protein